MKLFILKIFLVFSLITCSLVGLKVEAAPIQRCLFELLNLSPLPKADHRHKVFIEAEKHFQESNDIRFFLGKNEMKVPTGELQPGHSYTAIVHNNKLVIGRNIPGHIDGEMGGRGSHDTLTNYLKQNDGNRFIEDPYDFKAGAIGIKNDGTIVISGFHNRGPSQKSVDALEAALRKVFPGAIIDSHVGRLPPLDPVINPLKPTDQAYVDLSKPKTITTLSEVEQSFQHSDKVVFFDGAFNKAANQRAFDPGEFRPGNTYTALIVEEKLILGKNIYGKESPSTIGGSGSHITLFDFYNSAGIKDPTSWVDQSGAIGIGANGMIDISGYHFGKPNMEAAEKMQKLIKKICPKCTTRITDDKLETLNK